jgi:hypothetical protein
MKPKSSKASKAATLRGVAACALVAAAAACGGTAPSTPTPSAAPPAAPVPAPPSTTGFAGAWSGTAQDSQGQTTVTWTLTQNGADLSGTVVTQAINPDDGSCNSCHRNKRGTVTGTLAGTSLTLTMSFAAGADGDPTPECSATMKGTVTSLSSSRVSGSYTGSDTCEGPFLDGSMQLDRRAASIP